MSAAAKDPVERSFFLTSLLGPDLFRRGWVGRALAPHSRPRSVGGLAIATWSCLTLAAAVLISRRQSGAFAADMSAAAPCVACTFAVLLSLAADVLWHVADPAPPANRQRIAFALAVLGPLGWIAAFWPASFSVASSPFVRGYLGGLSVVAAAAAFVVADFFTTSEASSGTGEPARGVTGLLSGVSACPADPTMSVAAPAASLAPAADAQENKVDSADASLGVDEYDEADPSILQWTTRRQLADGGQTVEGAVRIAFDSGSRLAVAHVAFVPPLSDRPEAQCHVLADFNGRVRIGVALPYGLRIEARRAESDCDPLTIEVAFSARSRAVQSAAA